MKITTIARGLILFCAAAWFAGCSTTGQKTQQQQIVTEFLSEPPGARIEVNGSYIGEAPVKGTIDQWPDGVVRGRQVVRAMPKADGHFVQEKELRGPEFPFDQHRDRVPARMFFDTSLRPAAQPGVPQQAQ